MNTTSFIVLIGRALSLVRRHAGLFAAIVLAALVLEWLVYRFANTMPVVFATGIVVTSAVDAIVFARAKGDMDGWDAGQMWSRVLERLWAVVIVSFVFTYVATFGIALVAGGELLDRILAIPILLIAAALVFAEAAAVVVDEDQWWFVIVRAIGTSIRTAFSGSTLRRAIALFALQLVPVAVSSALAAAFSKGATPPSSFWTDVPLGILFSIPLDVLIVLAFFDASGYEPKRTCGE